jgi:hypothetical protein
MMEQDFDASRTYTALRQKNYEILDRRVQGEHGKVDKRPP